MAVILRHRPPVVLVALALVAGVYLFWYGFVRGEPVAEELYTPSSPSIDLPSRVTITDHEPDWGHGIVDEITQARIPEPATTAISTVTPANTSTDEVVFSLIIYGHDSAREGAVLIKSALMYTSVPLSFHIICDDAAERLLRHRLGLLHTPAHAVSVIFYRLSADAMQARLTREGAVVSDHSAGSPGLMKLFIHEILPSSVPRAIFVDTDAFFLHDPLALWRVFDDPVAFPAGTSLALPIHPDQHASEWHDANKICSCVLLLDLARLRAHNLMDSEHYRAASHPALSPSMFQVMFGPALPGQGYQNVKLGDQGYWWAVINGTEGFAAPLDYAWEISSCLLNMYGTDAAIGHDADGDDEMRSLMQHISEESEWAGQVILPRLVHFNCLDGADVYWEWDGWDASSDNWQNLYTRWGATVQYHVGFKWAWLNVGPTLRKGEKPHKGGPQLTLSVVDPVVFADEEFARARA